MWKAVCDIYFILILILNACDTYFDKFCILRPILPILSLLSTSNWFFPTQTSTVATKIVFEKGKENLEHLRTWEITSYFALFQKESSFADVANFSCLLTFVVNFGILSTLSVTNIIRESMLFHNWALCKMFFFIFFINKRMWVLNCAHLLLNMNQICQGSDEILS